MKFFKKLLILSAIFLVLLTVGASVYVKLYGKDLLEESLKNALAKNVELQAISYQFPLTLKAQGIRIAHLVDNDEFFTAKNITAGLSVDSFVQRRLIFDSAVFVEPTVVVEKIKAEEGASDNPTRRHEVVVPPQEKDILTAKGSGTTDESESKIEQAQITIKQLVLKKGHVQYTNSSIDKDFSVAIEDVYLKAQRLVFPIVQGRADFSMSGRLVKKGNPLSGSLVEGSGWVDVVKRDMEAKVLVTEADGSVGMTAEAVSQNNDMQVKGEMKFQNIFMGAKKKDSEDASAVNELISNALVSAGVEIGAKFSFKTKMDDFRPEQVSFSGNVLTK